MSLLSAIQGISDPDFQALLEKPRDFEAIAQYLNTKPLIDNPAPQGNVPAPIDPGTVLSSLPTAEQAAIFELPMITTWAAAILKDDAVATEVKGKVTEIGAAIANTLEVTGEMSFLQAASAFIKVGDRPTVGKILDVLLATSTISEATHTALTTALSATIPDPSYQAQILGQSITEQNGLGVVNASQIQEVLA